VRALIAPGGNAMTGPDGSATVEAQERAIGTAVRHVAEVVAAGVEVVLTHGGRPGAPAELRSYAAAGQFASGSMGPVEAVARFVEQGGRRAVITDLDRIARAVTGPGTTAGTVVEQG